MRAVIAREPPVGSRSAGVRRAVIGRDESGLILTLLILVLLGLTVGLVMWATARGRASTEDPPPSRLASCSLLADTALVEAKGRLIGILDAQFQRGEPLAAGDRVVTSGAMHGSSYRVSVRAAEAASVLEQRMTLTSVCSGDDGTKVTVVAEGHASTRSALDPPFCSCGDLRAQGALSVSFSSVDGVSTNPAALLIAANGNVVVPEAAIEGGLVCGGDLRGHGLPAGGSYAGGANELGGAASVLPTPRPCRCDDTLLERGLGEPPPPSVVAGSPPPPSPAKRTKAAASSSKVAASAPVQPVGPPSCSHVIDGSVLVLKAGSSCRLDPGRYELGGLTLEPGAQVLVGGPIRMVWNGPGPFDLGAGTLGNAGAPDQLTIEARGAADIRIGGGELRALIFAPRSRVTVDAQATIRGALVAGALELGPGVHLEGDRSGSKAGLFVSDFVEETWRIDPPTSSSP